MAKTLSVYRRRANLVDLFLVARQGAKSYLFKSAPNFDVGAAPMQSVPKYGYRSSSAPEQASSDSQFRDRVRFTFNPSDYGLDDTKPFWLRIQQVNMDGTVGPDEAYHLILPYGPMGRKAVVLRGQAPSGASLADSREIQLQHQMQGVSVQNDGSVDLYMAFDPGGPEMRIAPLSSGHVNVLSPYSTISQLFVRGDGATTTFGMIMSERNETV